MDKRSAYEDLRSRIASCRSCPLWSGRTKAVPGEGNLDSPVMFVGEAPGATEDREGRPFVGAAGQLLNAAIESAGWRREDVYITNVVKCRPPNNRTPNQDEVAACIGYLREEIRLVRPKVIVALGNTAGEALSSLAGRQWRGVTSSRGRPVKVTIEGVDVVLFPTYHPAAALYKPDLKDRFLADVREALGLARAGERRTLLDFMK